MPREDYDEIKEKFGIFIRTWKDRDTKVLDAFVDPEIVSYMSIEAGYKCGSKHTIFGIRNFIHDIPKTDVFHSRICNYVCRFNQKEAQQYAVVVCLAADYGKDGQMKTFEFSAMMANHWRKTENGWVLDELRMDVEKHGGNLDSFEKIWYFDNPQAVVYDGLHWPCINAELDSPWYRIPNSEDVLNDEEKISEAYARYAFAIDWISFENLREVLSEDVVSTMPGHVSMGKRDWIVQLKFQRQKYRYWVHPCIPLGLSIDGDEAHVTFYRMSGHRQRDHEYEFTRDNIDTEHACAKYVMHFRKEKDNVWRIVKNTYYLGFVELGEYQDDLYRS